MKRTFEEIVAHHVEKIGWDENAKKKFFAGGIKIQEDPHNYSKKFLEAKLATTCEVMCRIGGCHHTCDRCKLEEAHRKAIADIDNGLRHKEDLIYERHTTGDYICRMTMDRKTGIITQVLVPKGA